MVFPFTNTIINLFWGYVGGLLEDIPMFIKL